MQQVYQQQMESQASLLNTNSSSSTAQTSTETLDMSSLKISENNLAAQESNADTNEDNEKESEDFDENHDTEDHECAEECGFGPDDDGKDEFVYISAVCLQFDEIFGACFHYKHFVLISVSPASMWTKKELKDFKDSIRKEGGDSIIKVKLPVFIHFISCLFTKKITFS